MPCSRLVLLLVQTNAVQNWGKELKLWLGERVVPVVVDDTRADHVKKSFQVGAALLLCRCWPAGSLSSVNTATEDKFTTGMPIQQHYAGNVMGDVLPGSF
jgi:hypothetical protein